MTLALALALALALTLTLALTRCAQWANVTAVFLRPRILGNICHMMNENILPLLEVLNGTTSPVELFTFPGHQVRARVRVRAG